MTAFTWAVRLLVFFLLLLFSLRNAQMTTVRLLFDYVWEAPLVIVLLASFSAGAVLGALSLSRLIFRQRREIAQLKREASLPRPPADLPPAPLE